MNPFEVVIGGEVITGAASRAVREPWSSEPVAEVAHCDEAAAERAVAHAAAGFELTRRLPSYVRRDLLRKIAERLTTEQEAFAELIAREAGKPITQARAEVLRAVSTFDLASEEVSRDRGEVMALDVTPAAAGYQGQFHREPSGPVLAITPFNFPLNLVAHKVAPALACGATVVVKPSPQAPLSALSLARLVRDVAREVGTPEGALQVVPCDLPVAERLVKDDRFRVLSFTGSDRAGWHLRAIAGKKRVSLELGGNAAALVHEDAPLDYAADRITTGAFAYAGQVCIKVQRVIVHRAVAERFVGMLVDRAARLAPADPMLAATLMGPMIDEANAVRVVAWVDEARAAHGTTILLAGGRERNRLGPSVIRLAKGTGAGLHVLDDEVFGPVLTVQTYDTWDEALALADATRFGLQCGLFTDSLERIRAAMDRLRVGGLIVGDVPTFRVDNMPYGGMRDSGLGREGVRFAMAEMTEPKLVVWARRPS